MGQQRKRFLVIEPWKKLESRAAGDFRIFTIRSEKKRSPRTQKDHDFYVIDSVNWVNVVALTANDEIVMVEQFRHGSDSVELEVPGGMMDAGDSSPEFTAERELKEETGYGGERPRIIGEVFPNPAIMSNTCYTVLIENCRCIHPVQFDQSEDIVTRLVPAREISTLVQRGKIKHALVVAALYAFELARAAR